MRMLRKFPVVLCNFMKATKIKINLNALQANLKQVRHYAGQAKIWAMIKSDAYGHGLVPVATALKDADAFGVATLDEAVTLRHAGIKQPIIVLSRFDYTRDLPVFADHDLSLVIYHNEHLKMLANTPLKSPITIWLKLDTGMHRLGIAAAEAKTAWQCLQEIPWVKKPVGIMSHWACADEAGHPDNEQQFKSFQQATHDLPGPKSMANSALMLNYPQAVADWVRSGIMLYGASSIAGKLGRDLELTPVMTLSSYLLSVYRVKKGEKIGYSHTYTCPHDMTVGVVAIGYGDGYPRHAITGTPTWVNGTICPLLGRVSMDLIVIDLTAKPDANLGDEVILWGPELPVETVAECAGTISFELLTHIGRRIKCIDYCYDN